MFKYFLSVFSLLPISMLAQTYHGFGAGAFIKHSFLSGTEIGDNNKFSISVAPYLGYKLNYHRVQTAFGIGISKNNLKYKAIFTNAQGQIISKSTFSDTYDYFFVPASIGINLLHGSIKFGIKADAQLTYLRSLTSHFPAGVLPDGKTTIKQEAAFIDSNYNRFGMSAGGGVFISHVFSRIEPCFSMGYLRDLQVLYKRSSARFNNPYVEVSVQYVINLQVNKR